MLIHHNMIGMQDEVSRSVVEENSRFVVTEFSRWIAGERLAFRCQSSDFTFNSNVNSYLSKNLSNDNLAFNVCSAYWGEA